MNKPFRMAEEPIINELPMCKKYKGSFIQLFKLRQDGIGQEYILNGTLYIIMKVDDTGQLGPALYIENEDVSMSTSVITKEIINNWEEGFVIKTTTDNYRIIT